MPSISSPAPPPIALPHPGLKAGVLALLVAALGLPINDLGRYALLVVATVLVVTGVVTLRPLRWLGAVGVIALGLLAREQLALPSIDEGHNVFLVDRAGGALETGLPPQAFAAMQAELARVYPPARRCDPAVDGCWRGQGFPDRTFAFSADGIYQRAPLSRRVTGIGFSDAIWLRLGFVNEGHYNWNAEVSDIDRATRDRRFWQLVHRWHLTMPWFVMYRLPDELIGSKLCWRGKVLWEGEDESFAEEGHTELACRVLLPADGGRRVFGVAIDPAIPLAMELRPPTNLRLRQWLASTCTLLVWGAVLLLLVRPGRARALPPFLLIAASLAMVLLHDASFVDGVRPFDAGADGLVYDGYARVMLQKLLAGDALGALEGEEKVFYYTPGMRYLRVVEHLVFGETYLGYLALMLLLPFLVLWLLKRFLPLNWALASVIIFTAIPIGVVFGTSLLQYVKWAARGFADPAAAVLFLAGLVLLLDRRDGPRDRIGRAAASGLLFALAVFVRPNLAPGAGVLLAGAGLAALWQRQLWRVTGLVAGFLPVLGMALHNWYYGRTFALFTSTAAHPGALVTPPWVYGEAFMELLRLDLSGPHLARAVRQLGGWLAGPSEAVLTAPLHAAAIVVLVRVVVWRAADPWLRLIALATLAQQCVGMFYMTYGRYYYLTWLLTLVVVLVWAHDEGVALASRRFPRFAELVAQHSATRALARGLDRTTLWVGARG
ncbi:MAG: hypothetical protein IT537_04830 [Hyphomicrobiales bacterium]|nr:hypothetical protein [Hyphomicrobiales bacterium]